MNHEERAGGADAMHVDHFRPAAGNDYGNLFWSCAVCNTIKSDTWPSAEELAKSIRFVNPCEEWDYGEHFFQNDVGGLESVTVAGGYHVDMLHLNRDGLVRLRQEADYTREYQRLLKKKRGFTGDEDAAAAIIDQALDFAERQLAKLIPFIPRFRPSAP